MGEYAPFSQEGATSELGMMPKMTSNDTVSGPKGPMYINMEQVHRANRMQQEERSPKQMADGIDTAGDSIGAPTVDAEEA